MGHVLAGFMEWMVPVGGAAAAVFAWLSYRMTVRAHAAPAVGAWAFAVAWAAASGLCACLALYAFAADRGYIVEVLPKFAWLLFAPVMVAAFVTGVAATVGARRSTRDD